jgi:hypothetical protein
MTPDRDALKRPSSRRGGFAAGSRILGGNDTCLQVEK